MQTPGHVLAARGRLRLRTHVRRGVVVVAAVGNADQAAEKAVAVSRATRRRFRTSWASVRSPVTARCRSSPTATGSSTTSLRPGEDIFSTLPTCGSPPISPTCQAPGLLGLRAGRVPERRGDVVRCAPGFTPPPPRSCSASPPNLHTRPGDPRCSRASTSGT